MRPVSTFVERMSEQELALKVLKDGRGIEVRCYEPNDFEALVSMYANLSEETLRWAMPPYHREKIASWVADLPNSIMLVAVSENKIVGHLMVTTMDSPRVRYTGELHVYLHQDFQNVGLGAIMVREGLSLAKKRGMHRVGLFVVADNERAIRLYEKLGFEREGLRPETDITDDGRYHDLVVMGILLWSLERHPVEKTRRTNRRWGT